MLNPYFSYFETPSETSLTDSLIQEVIQMSGVNIQFSPRELVHSDYLFGEDYKSAFRDAYEIEVWVENFTGFGGQNDFVTKFGLEITDTINLTMSQTRFTEVTGITRPKEGDLIYFPISTSLFEIKFVENEGAFYNGGALPVYNIKCALFNYSQETLETGVVDIDGVATRLINNNSVDNDKFSDNVAIETESDSIKPLDESNVFGDF